MPPVDEREVVGEHRLAEQRLGDPRAKGIGDRHHFLGGARGAGADQHRNALARVEDVRRTLEIGVRRQYARRRVADARMRGAVLVCRRRGLLFLDVLRQHDAGRRAARERDAECTIDHVSHLRGRRHHLHVFVRDVLEERDEIDLLLEVCPERGAGLLADDGDHRLVVRLRVVQAVDEMNRAGPGGGEAHAHLR